MTLFDRLANNKGTVSSALGKEIAKEILNGNNKLLSDTIPFVNYELKKTTVKHIRAGAAKIIECVAEKRPDLVAPYLERILSALEAEEPQTKWMIFMTLGYCSKIEPTIAEKALPYAKKYILEKTNGQLCLVGAIDMYLGNWGTISKENAQKAYKLLVESTNNVIMNEQDWILEGFLKIVEFLNSSQKKVVTEFANEYIEYSKKVTQKRAQKIIEKCK
ncbi:MAG: hypothetical protein V1874_04150 [Spirochaetota bacterium]